MTEKRKLEVLDVELERDGFLRDLIRELSGTLEDVVGLDQASGFVSLVGQRIGESINTKYRRALGQDSLDPETVSAIFVDLKRRIHGSFVVVEHTPERIVLTNSDCPFEEKVIGRPSMCMMTSNVFGTIAAENLGYARVSLKETIAAGDAGCRVIVHLSPDDNVGNAIDTREYFKTDNV